jgi:small subunit ribosomal protein S6
MSRKGLFNPIQMKYELMFILNTKQTEKELESSMNAIKESVEENGFKIFDEDVLGQRDLAYKIKGLTTGYYWVINIEGDQAGSIQLRNDLTLMNPIVRFLIMKIEDSYVLTRYDETPINMDEDEEEEAKPAPKLSKHAEELAKKVSGAAKKEEVKEETKEEVKEVAAKEEKKEEKPAEAEEAEAPKTTEEPNLDEKLKAIIDDEDIDV